MIELLASSLLVATCGVLLAGGLTRANRATELQTKQILSTQLLASNLALLESEVDSHTPTSGAFAAPLEHVSWMVEWTEEGNSSLPRLARTSLVVEQDGYSVDVVTYRRISEE